MGPIFYLHFGEGKFLNDLYFGTIRTTAIRGVHPMERFGWDSGS